MKKFLTTLRRIPAWAYPQVARHALARRLRLDPIPPPELSDSDLDFFFGSTGAVDSIINHYSFNLFSAFTPPTPSELENILNHRIEIFGSLVDVGSPIQWRRDFNTGHEWARDHISKLQLVTPKGDVKIPWELSRFQHGVKLALGYKHFGDLRFVNEWLAQFNSWRADNPPEHGCNWGNAMEAAIRAVNWIVAYHFIQDALNRPAKESILKALIQHGRFIFTHLEEFFPFNNHLIADLCGLIWLGIFLHPAKEAERWLSYGLRELTNQLRIQILPDGASYEASTAYHRFVTEMIVSTVEMCDRNLTGLKDLSGLAKMRETADKMIRVVDALRKPDSSIPLFGDEDGGRWIANYQLPITNPQSPVPNLQSFPHAGWFIYRHEEEYLAIRAGGNGQLGWGGHAHNDALSFEYSIGDRNFLIDPGTYTYTADPDMRNLFRSTACHNTLRVDGQEISRIPEGELFRLEDDARCRVIAQNDSMWEGEHGGYKRLGVIHRRRFEKTATGWRIGDTVSGVGSRALEWFFHFDPSCAMEIDQNRVVTKFASRPNIQLISNLQSLILNLEEGFASRAYGQRAPAPVAVFRLNVSLPIEVEFVISLFSVKS
jgi:uncharacterized heparinase superfamily protein